MNGALGSLKEVGGVAGSRPGLPASVFPMPYHQYQRRGAWVVSTKGLTPARRCPTCTSPCCNPRVGALIILIFKMRKLGPLEFE